MAGFRFAHRGFRSPPPPPPPPASPTPSSSSTSTAVAACPERPPLAPAPQPRAASWPPVPQDWQPPSAPTPRGLRPERQSRSPLRRGAPPDTQPVRNEAHRRRAWLEVLRDDEALAEELRLTVDDLLRHGRLLENPGYMTLATTAFGRRHMWAAAFDLLERARGAGSVDTVLHTSVVTACERASKWELATRLVDDILAEAAAAPAVQHAGSWRGGGSGGGGAVPAFATAMSACLRSHEWQRALQLFRRLGEEGLRPSIVSYNVAISASGRGQLWHGALELLAEAEAMAVPTVITYSAGINACGEAHRWDAALAILRRMRATVPPDVVTCSSVISICVKAHKWTLALDKFSEMCLEGPAPNVVSFNAALTACEKGQQWALALHFLAYMFERGLRPTATSCNVAMSVCEKASRWSATLTLLVEMEARGPKPTLASYDVAVAASSRGGDLKLQSELRNRVTALRRG